ncbi:NifB/NifX family molybdenum-iron cluster-binding protein [Butyrivibrio sp. AE3004]|uniref:NifB/NifX family molybdenum-iron cluster-binding protein n=1 Tax=Butyrivibrio sp. AE3004 TaxID=1506994 RepID=UPI000494AB03|nr:NifB/NifX family molybdenum-iron cluster-binding protein [Butyrivibrio sp. AE3004]
MADEKFKVAVATSDGINVDSHFGHVTEFTIYDVDVNSGEGEPAESREISVAGCSDGSCGEVGTFDRIAERLSDVEYVLAAKIGPRAVMALGRANIIAIDAVIPIDKALSKLKDYRDKKKQKEERARRILSENGIVDK